MRSRNRTSVAWVSARASGAPAHVWMPCPKARCWRPFGPVEPELARVLELARVAAPGVGHHEHGGAGREVDAADRGGDLRQLERALQRRLGPQHLLDERPDEVGVVAQPLLELGMVAEGPEAHHDEPGRGLAAGREEVGRDPHDVLDRRQRAVGERRVRHLGHDVVARVGAAVLDVAGELLVEESERLVLAAAAVAPCARASRGTRRGLRRARRGGRRSPSG